MAGHSDERSFTTEEDIEINSVSCNIIANFHDISYVFIQIMHREYNKNEIWRITLQLVFIQDK